MKAFRATARMSSSRRMFWGMVFTFLITGGLLSLGVFLFSPDRVSANQYLDISLRSPLFADYSQDERGRPLPRMDIALAAEAARDRIPTPGPEDAQPPQPYDPEPTLEVILLTPVPTVTPGSIHSQPSPTAQPTLGSQLTATPLSSATPSPTSGASATPGLLETTAAPTRTSAALTPVPPTRTPTRTPTRVPPTATAAAGTPTPTRPLPVATTPAKTLPPTLPPTRTPLPTSVPTIAPTTPPTAYPLPTDPPEPTQPPEPTAYPFPTDPPPPPEPTSYPYP